MKPVYSLENGMGVWVSPDGKSTGYSIPGDSAVVNKGSEKKRGGFMGRLIAGLNIRGTRNTEDR